MTTELVINSRPHETRVALVENSLVTEYYLERVLEKGLAGNIYKGRVIRVLPGMQAAFVDIGLEKAAFIYVTDVYDNSVELIGFLDQDFHSKEDGPAGRRDDSEPPECNHLDTVPFRIEDLLHEGQDILVQISKEPLGTKGPRITSHISLPGRHLVMMPMVEHIGISRRIEDENERRRLKDILQRIKPRQVGLIARTACEEVEEEKIAAEMSFLTRLWQTIQKKSQASSAPHLIHQDLNITLRSVRDLFTKEVDRLIIDSREEYERILNFIDTFMPSLKYSVELYEDPEPIFDNYGIEMEVSRALAKKVWLKSGGYIVIENTEALVAIDVNTGRYVGKRNLEETILKTNLEAVKEIAYQLRLRNIGGLIVIDFIDLEKESNREKVFNALREALRKDRHKTNILRMSELGLIEMTRKRTRENINQYLCEPCFYCEGEGVLKSQTTICNEIFRDIEREAVDMSGNMITVTVHPAIADLLLDEKSQLVSEFQNRLNATITIKPDENLHLEEFEVDAV
ncbi:MAG: Rne/Rng family ribonuclease [Deltaproteobacteria bacterium]|nr:Rne/Rng family ribonuclease [Deltaproteobacteria bacterium]